MKVAICFSGQLRTGVRALDYHLRFLDGVDYDSYVHTWVTDSQRPNWIDSPVNSTDIDTFCNHINAINVKVEDYRTIDLNLTDKVYSPHTWYSYQQAFNLIPNPHEYDVIIKHRPDVIFHKSRTLMKDIHLLMSKSRRTVLFDGLSYYWTTVDKFTSDLCFLGKPKEMQLMSGFYDIMEKEPNPGLFLKRHGVTIGPTTQTYIRQSFTILRPWAKSTTFEEVHATMWAQ